MSKPHVSLLLLPTFFASIASAQVTSKTTSSGCVDLSGKPYRITVTGTLTKQSHFRPEAIIQAIAPVQSAGEDAFIVELPKPICVDDLRKYADPSEQISQVQILPNKPAHLKQLERAVGRRIVANGLAFHAVSGFYAAPFVLLTHQIKVR